MDSTTRLAVAIVLAAALLLFGFIAYHEFERERDISEAQAALAAIGEQGKQVVAQLQQQNAVNEQQALQVQQRARQEVAMSWDRRLLEGNQLCVGGVVVVVDGSSYTQLGTVGDPVRCAGGYADRAIR